MVCGMNLFIRCAAIFSLSATGTILMADPPAGADWKLVYEDNFDRPRAELDKDWNFRNANEWKALSSRWAENAVVENGVLKLLVKKEKLLEEARKTLSMRIMQEYGLSEDTVSAIIEVCDDEEVR